MRLDEVLVRLRAKGIAKVGTWELRGRRAIILGDPTKYFPHPVGPQYSIDITDDHNPELRPEEIEAIERRFGEF